MRIVFINLHMNSMIVETFLHHITKKSMACKHRYLLDYLLEHYEVCSYVNSQGVSFFKNNKVASALRFIEYNYVMKLNKINKRKIKLLKNSADIRSDDIVIMYGVMKDQLYKADEINAFKVASMIHFFGDKLTSVQLQKSGVDCFLSEADLSKHSEIFKENYGWFTGSFVIQPFVFQQRFKREKEFSMRYNRAVAVGTVTFPDHVEDFVEFYGHSCYQPLRKQIYDNQNELAGYVDCYIYKYYEEQPPKKVSPYDWKFVSWYKKIYNLFRTGKQKSYFSFNMVKKFNEYKMCIVPEDIHGMPGVGFVEGMACGCAYIGLNYSGYRDLGLVEGVHYIGYDGTIDDLRKKIMYYQADEHQDELKKIADEGYKFVCEHFNSISAAKLVIDTIIELAMNKNACK